MAIAPVLGRVLMLLEGHFRLDQAEITALRLPLDSRWC